MRNMPSLQGITRGHGAGECRYTLLAREVAALRVELASLEQQRINAQDSVQVASVQHAELRAEVLVLETQSEAFSDERAEQAREVDELRATKTELSNSYGQMMAGKTNSTRSLANASVSTRGRGARAASLCSCVRRLRGAPDVLKCFRTVRGSGAAQSGSAEAPGRHPRQSSRSQARDQRDAPPACG